MSAKLLCAGAYLLLVSPPLWGQFFLDFYSQGTLAWRSLRSPSSELRSLPTLAIGIASRPRPFFSFSFDVALSGSSILDTAHEPSYLVWAELSYRLLLHARYRRHAALTPSFGLEWGVPLGLTGTEGTRGNLVHDLRRVRFGTFAGLSVPLPGSRRYTHVLVGGQWLLGSPVLLAHSFIPELRLIWESP